MDDFGGKLRQARERRGISLRQIAASTKIAAAALEALERNDISKLPGGIFSRAFVRSYAIEVGLDPEETVREFLERFNQEPPPADDVPGEIPAEERAFQDRQRKAARLAIGAAIAVVVLIAALVIAYRARIASRTGSQPQSAEPPAAVTPDPAAPPSQAPPSAQTPVAAEPAPAAIQAVRLEIAPTSDCWVSVTVDGRKMLGRIVPAGEKQTFTVTKDATVDVGDAGAFAYSVNGKPGKPLGEKGQVRTLKLTPATAAQFIR